MDKNFGTYVVDGDVLDLPSYDEDPVFYHDNRVEYIRMLEAHHGVLAVMSARKPTLDELDEDCDY